MTSSFCVCRILDDSEVDDTELLAGKWPSLLTKFVERAAAEETPYLSIMSSLYFFQVRVQNWVHC